MSHTANKLLRQPGVAVVSVTLALGSLGLAAMLGSLLVARPGVLIEGGALIAALILAYLFPIYLRHNVKLCVTSVSLFLAAVLLPPFAAGLIAFIGMGVGEMVVRRQRGTGLADIATQAGRMALATLAGSLAAHLALPIHGEVGRILPLALAGATMWILDIGTLPVALIPVSSERYVPILRSAIREGGIPEAAQYALGIAGVFLAQLQPAALILLVPPAGLVYFTFKKEMDADTFQLLEQMADNVDLRGSYTIGHSRRVAELVSGLLDELNMHGQEAAQILVAARLHDLGKIGLPDQLLVSPHALAPEERRLIEAVPGRGVEMLAGYQDVARALEMVRHHAERFDGTGYPDRLVGTDIPFGARVIAIADAYEAMTSERSYRRALSPEQATQILRDGAGRPWDPQLVRAFLASIGQDSEDMVLASQHSTEPVHASLTPNVETDLPALLNRASA